MTASVLLYAVEDPAPRALPIPEGVRGFDGLYEGLTLGVYEALRTYHHARFLDLDEHMARLTRSMVRLGLNHTFDEVRMRAAIQRVCSDAPFAEMRVRFDILAAPARARGSDSRELVALAAFHSPPRELYTRGVQVVTTRAISRSDPLAKTADFVEQRRRIERGTPDAYERLITEPSGAILEGFSSNFYVVREGELITAGDGVLEGVTRRIVLAQAAELGIRVRLEAPRRADLDHIQEAAISSSSRGLVPVVRIDDRPVGSGIPGPVITALIAAYETHVARWSTPAVVTHPSSVLPAHSALSSPPAVAAGTMSPDRIHSPRRLSMAITRHEITTGPGPRMSRCVVKDDMVYVAGLTASDASGDITSQTQQILDKIDGYLAGAGTDKSKLLQANLWITDMSNFSAMNAVWNAWVDPENPPVRACVRADLARPELLVEIMVTATR